MGGLVDPPDFDVRKGVWPCSERNACQSKRANRQHHTATNAAVSCLGYHHSMGKEETNMSKRVDAMQGVVSEYGEMPPTTGD